MHLKRIELFGFKSFADKTQLEFGPGIAAVIGPNGCGKSNLVDAVRWALGEQSVKALRGSRMEEIIFSGSESRKALNFAEVSLTFTGAGSFLDIDYEEVTVTRRLFRSGESEYYINKTPCRLKDITEMFLDTGVGKDIYSIIGQGRVEEIINSKPEERREIFEEAAGILKYKLRKKEARRRLEETRENLVRVQDLIYELEHQVEPLEAQAEVTRKYRRLRGRIGVMEKQLLSHKLVHAREELARVEKRLEGVVDELANATAAEGLREEQVQTLKLRRQDQARLRDELEQKITRVSREIEQYEGELRLLEERDNRYRERLEQGNRRCEEMAEAIKALEEQRRALDQEMLQIKAAWKAAEERCGILRSDLEYFEKSILLNEVEEQQQNLYRCGTRLKTAEAAVEELSRQIERIADRRETLERERSALNSEMQQYRAGIAETKAGEEALADRLETALKEKAGLEKSRAALEQELDRLSADQQHRREEMHGIKSRLQLLQEQEAVLSGYYRGVREVLQAKASLPGIIGPVVDLLAVEDRYIRAVEAALGGALQFIVTETEVAAKTAISYLKEGGRGWGTFLPLDTIRLAPTGLERHAGWSEIDGVFGKASELVTVDPAYRKVVDYLLDSIVICRDLDVATRVARAIQYSCRVISLDGDMINPGGAIRGGSLPRRNPGLPMGRRKEIEALEREQAGLHKIIAGGEEKIEETHRKLEDAERDEKQAQQAGEELLEQVKAARRAVEDREKEAAYLQERLNTAAASLDSLQAEEAELRRRMDEYGKQRQDCTAEIALIEAALESKKELYQRSLAEKKELENFLTEALVALNSCQEQERALKRALVKIEENLAGPVREQQKIEREALESRDSLAENEAERKKISALLEQLYPQSAALVSEMDELKKQSDQILAGMTETEEEERRGRNRLARLEKRERQLALEQTRLQTEIEYQLKRYRELFRTTELLETDPSFEPEGCEQSVQALKEELDSLGEVNLGAIEELERLQERINFLKKQQDDLRKGELSLRKVLAEIDQRMEQFFNRAFQEIGSNMQEVYSELFEGGQVILKLTDLNNVLESGIEIIAQPPGKKLQNISLLSTGEKVLTAVALIFAILRYKPAPFYLLDEIESALDDVNLTRFTKYLKAAAREAQFIMITHRKRTMEEADFLYGVTMPERGVSRLVSLKLDEKAS